VRRDTLDLIRCPYCGGRVELRDSLFHRVDGDHIIDAVLGCLCCYFVVVAGIGLLTVEGQAERARQLIEDGRPDEARRLLLGVDAGVAARLEDRDLTYREVVHLLGATFEGGYFLYRFSDPTFVVADAVARTLAATSLGACRAIDLCGGSGHLTRTLTQVSKTRPVLLDLSFVKLWLARRFTVVGCEAICADAHAPLPFASGAFRLAICNDAFHYVWTKTLFAREMQRIVDREGVAAVTHVHNAEQWNPSAGNPLPPRGYRDLFENADTRVFGERALLEDVVNGRLNLARTQAEHALETDPALTVISSRRADVFVDRVLDTHQPVQGVLAINPLYDVRMDNGRARLCLRFPSKDYEDEYADCRRYLPEALTIDRATLAALEAGESGREIDALRDRRVLLDLPARYL
jgi:SAM-dependent methyltransferase